MKVSGLNIHVLNLLKFSFHVQWLDATLIYILFAEHLGRYNFDMKVVKSFLTCPEIVVFKMKCCWGWGEAMKN